MPSRFHAGLRWGAAVAFAVALHLGPVAYVVSSSHRMQDGDPDGAIDVELMPDASDPSATPDDVAGPKVAEAAPSGEQVQADDPDPPAPDSAAPTEKERQPEAKPELTAPPAPATAEAVLPPAEPDDEKPVDKPPEETPKAEKAEVEKQTAPSRASSGSTAQLEGGKRPTAAAKATWAGEIGTHLAHLRRYPREARAEGWQGTARVRVTLDENGHVTDRRLVESSGRPILDDEALALMLRSDPFPKPPSGMPVPVRLTVPVKFAIR